ncbi:MAG: hypothetical protein FWH14_08305, partial [Oscillospiraceae bacterium]|nr:hypothetical protein [Oscillospiraceae bacterium]
GGGGGQNTRKKCAMVLGGVVFPWCRYSGVVYAENRTPEGRVSGCVTSGKPLSEHGLPCEENII